MELILAARRVCDSKDRMTRREEITRRIHFLGYGACALAGSLWGTGFYFGRLALNEMSVEHMVLYRFLFACAGHVAGRICATGSASRAAKCGCC